MNKKIVIIISLIVILSFAAGITLLVMKDDEVVQDGGAISQIQEFTDVQVISAVPSFDNSAIWYFDQSARLYRADPETGEVSEFSLPALQATGNLTGVSWPVMGNDFLATTASSSERTVHYYGNNDKQYKTWPENIQSFDWMPDGRRVVYIWQSGDQASQQLVMANADTSGSDNYLDDTLPDDSFALRFGDVTGPYIIGQASNRIAVNADVIVGSTVSGVASWIEIGSRSSGNRYAYIDLVGDDTYTDNGARLIRGNTGPDTTTSLQHRGTGELHLNAVDAGTIVFKTSNLDRVYISSTGSVGIGAGAETPASLLELASSAPIMTWLNSSGTVGEQGMRIAFDNNRMTFQRASDAGVFEANYVSIIQDTGNVGLGGEISPEAKLHVTDTTAVTTFTGDHNQGIKLEWANTNGNWGFLGFTGGQAGNIAQIGVQQTGSGSIMSFGTSNSYPGVTNEALSIKYDGTVGIGTNDPNAWLEITKGGSTAGISPNSNANNLVLTNSADAGLSILTGNTNTGRIYFGDSDSNLQGWVTYDHSSSFMALGVGGSERARIKNNGAINLVADSEPTGAAGDLYIDTTTKGLAQHDGSQWGRIWRTVHTYAGNSETRTTTGVFTETFSVPANALNKVGSIIRIKAWGTFSPAPLSSALPRRVDRGEE